MLAGDILKGFDFNTDLVSTHLWLHLPEPWRATDFTAQLLAHGVRVIESEVFAVGRGEVLEVEVNDAEESLRVTLADGHSDGSFIADVLVKNGFRVKSLKEEEIDLEDVFMGITKGITQ